MAADLELPIYLFHQGTACRAYELLGCHFTEKEGRPGCMFRVWAPNARAVHVTGSFDDWQVGHGMERVTGQGLWEVFVPGVDEFDLYRFRITGPDGQVFFKTDPYGYHMETRPATASKAIRLDGYQWNDRKWMETRAQVAPYDRPVNIYEMHPGSWRRYADGNFFDYEKLADELLPYVLEMGYTHIELMPVMEHPYDGSWGYQVMGYFAPTSRYGTPEGFMAFVDAAHQAGIGVILDWVPGHFPKNSDGLARFDGGPCYEYQDPLKREHEEWGTLIFDWGRNEVRSFLISNAVFWFDRYHVDGLRVDAVASMLYLDYGRHGKGYRPNIHGGRENLEAVAFLRDLNTAVFREFPNVLMIAEESTAWPLVTSPADTGGLGFNFKWNMGWMNDTLAYMQTDPLFRRGRHEALTFPMAYAFSENYILPLSHDEVVHGKGSLLGRMPGSYEEKFAGLRAYLAFMMAHPGKKLLFMGGEFGQFAEWNHEKELDWSLLTYPSHKGMQAFTAALNHFYKETPAFWELEQSWDGFRWIDADDRDRNLAAFVRTDRSGGTVLVVSNFSAVPVEGYTVRALGEGELVVAFDTDDPVFFGEGRNQTTQREDDRIRFDLPPLSTRYFTWR